MRGTVLAHTTSSQFGVKDCHNSEKKCTKTDMLVEDGGNYMHSTPIQYKKNLRDIKDNAVFFLYEYMSNTRLKTTLLIYNNQSGSVTITLCESYTHSRLNSWVDKQDKNIKRKGKRRSHLKPSQITTGVSLLVYVKSCDLVPNSPMMVFTHC